MWRSVLGARAGHCVRTYVNGVCQDVNTFASVRLTFNVAFRRRTENTKSASQARLWAFAWMPSDSDSHISGIYVFFRLSCYRRLVSTHQPKLVTMAGVHGYHHSARRLILHYSSFDVRLNYEYLQITNIATPPTTKLPIPTNCAVQDCCLSQPPRVRRAFRCSIPM